MNDSVVRLEDVFRRVLEESRKLRFDRSHAQQVYAACMHAAVLAQFSAALTLLKEGKNDSVPGILRDLLETYADLVNLCHCPEYVVRIQTAYLAKQGRVLRLAEKLSLTNPAVRRLAGDRALREAYEKTAHRLAEYERFGLGVLPIRDRFERAGLAALHDSVYATLAIFSTHNLTDLPSRFLEDSEGHQQIAALKPWQSELLEGFLHTLAGVLVDAYRRVVRLSPKPEADGLHQVALALREYVSGIGGRKAA